MLGLIVQVADARLAIDVRDITQVLPLAQLQSYSSAPRSLTGLLLHHRQIVPVFDLATLRGGIATEPRLRTRLIIIQTRSNIPSKSFGIVIDQVLDVRSFDEQAFQAGRLILDDQGPIEVIDLEHLLPADACDWLQTFTTAEVA
mgnify:FL=1